MRTTILIISTLLNTALFAQSYEVKVHGNPNEYAPNEPSICINRTNVDQLIGGANIFNHYFSNDGGKSWSAKQLKSSFGVWGDPVLHSDIDGHIYFLHLARTKGKSKNYGFIDRIVIQTSTDGGKTFNDGAYAGFNGDKVQDKPWISTDDYSAKRKGNAYITWTEFDQYGSKSKDHHSRIQFSKSTDKGSTWSEAITISDSIGDAVDDDHTLEGATTAVDRNGNIYCVWAGHHKLYFDKSTDGGNTWGKDRVIHDQHSGWTMDIPHLYRCNGMPFLSIDNSNGPNQGRLFLVWGDDKTGDADVYFSYSDDQGITWSAPKTVHTNRSNSQYLPNLAVDQTTGHVAVLYYDRSASPNNIFTDVKVAVSTDGGEHFESYQLNGLIYGTAGPSSFSGDYLDVDFHAGRIAAIWQGHKIYSQIFSRVTNLDELKTQETNYQAEEVEWYVPLHPLRIYVGTTIPMEVELIFNKRRLFNKELKEKDRLSHKIDPPQTGKDYTEVVITPSQNRRVRVLIKPQESYKGTKKEGSVFVQ